MPKEKYAQLTAAGLKQMQERAAADPAFHDLDKRFIDTGIMNWLKPAEKTMLFAMGAYFGEQSVIVEIGSFQGGSASFFAGGIASRGKGRLHSVDPHLGGPPWLGMAPHQRTISIFGKTMSTLGLSSFVQSHVGESTAIAAVWPAQPIDVVFIDGDHSFLGALKDFECWMPKLRPGGLVVVDDADDDMLPELLDFIEELKGIEAVKYVATTDGMAVFQRTGISTVKALANLSETMARRGIQRAWDFRFLHDSDLPPSYARSRSWPDDHGLGIAYQLIFLARCGKGDYGYSQSVLETDREVLHSLSRDRRDGEVVELRNAKDSTRRFRGIFCSPDEAAEFAPLLISGGILIVREATSDSIAERKKMLEAGLEGVGSGSGLQWGAWQPGDLSPEAIIRYGAAALKDH